MDEETVPIIVEMRKRRCDSSENEETISGKKNKVEKENIPHMQKALSFEDVRPFVTQ